MSVVTSFASHPRLSSNHALELFQYLYAFLTNSMVDLRNVNTRPSSVMIVFAVRILEGMFVVGILGSVLVVVLTAFDDIRELFGRHDDGK